MRTLIFFAVANRYSIVFVHFFACAKERSKNWQLQTSGKRRKVDEDEDRGNVLLGIFIVVLEGTGPFTSW